MNSSTLNPPARRTKAQRGHDLIAEAAGKIEWLYAHQLLRIAQAINPALEEFQAHFVIMDDQRWLDSPSLSGHLKCLARLSTTDYGPHRALVFWREEIRSQQSRITAHDVRLCYEFPGGENRPTVWLDAETGLPWLPLACQAHVTEDARRKIMFARHAEETRLARGELAKIEAEQNTYLGWHVIHTDWQAERDIEALQLCRRKNKKSEWKVIETYGTRYHPPGALLPKDQQEPFRLAYLVKQEAKQQEQTEETEGA